MDADIFQQLHNEGLITQEELTATTQLEDTRLFSLHWDLRSLLYSGILMLASGLGLLIYKHIDAIGHITIVTGTGLLSAGCLAYCFKNAQPFSTQKVEAPNLWFDYILILGCMLMVTFMGYLQYQFHVFGNRWGLATFIPAVILFALAYYFDHKGVLSLGITTLGAWLGVAVEPVALIRSGIFNHSSYAWSGIIFGVVLTGLYIATNVMLIKAHFGLTYKNFALHSLMLSLVAAMFYFSDMYVVYFLALAVVFAFYFSDAVRNNSFYFLLFSVLYGYAGLSGFLGLAITSFGSFNEGIIYLFLLYFIGSAAGLIALLRHYNQKFHKQ